MNTKQVLMDTGRACAIFRDLDNKAYTRDEKNEAIQTVASMATHNGIRKEDCIKALRLLIENRADDMFYYYTKGRLDMREEYNSKIDEAIRGKIEEFIKRKKEEST